MRRWHSFLEVLQQPLKMLFIAVLFLGIGNLLTNPVFNPYWVVSNEYLILLAEGLAKLGSFLIIYFPFFFFLRLVSRRNNGIVTVLIGVFGYFTFLVFTIFFADASLPQSATAPLFGLSVTSSQLSLFSGIRYPIQTGMIGVILITVSTRLAYAQSRKKGIYGILSFVDRDTWAMILNFIYAILIAFIVSFGWTGFIRSIESLVSFIATDISNPINIFVYGVTERALSVMNLGNLIRIPFWYGNSGGTWMNIVGNSIAGDVNVWTAMISQGLVPIGSGRFITPYYVLNLFAVPGMLWGVYSIYSDRLERRRIRLFFILATGVSLFMGTLLPLEIMLVFLCPLLFVFHILFTGTLFGVFQAMGVSLGFSYSGNPTIAMPGTLLEYLNYARNSKYQEAVLVIFAVGIASAIIYFFVTRIYFKYLSIDLFKGGAMKEYVDGTVEAMGGIENIKGIHSSLNRITIQVFDGHHLNLFKARELGASRIVETKAGFSLDYGPGSGMIKRGIEKQLRSTRREDN